MLRRLLAAVFAICLLSFSSVPSLAQSGNVMVHLGGGPMGGTIAGAPGSTVTVPVLIVGSTGMIPSTRPEITVPAPLRALATSSCTAETILATAGAESVFRACNIVSWEGPNGSQIISTEVEDLSSMTGFRINAWLQIEIPDSTPVESSYKLTAPSVQSNGFPTLSEFSIFVEAPTPTAHAEPVATTAPIAVPPQTAPVDDNRILYLEMTPQHLRITPDGAFLYVVQPVRWGMWDGQQPKITLRINVPDSLSTAVSPKCGRGDRVPSTHCDILAIDEDEDSKTYVIEPGYSAADGTLNGVYLELGVDIKDTPGQVFKISANAEVEDDSLPSQPAEVFSTVQIVSEDTLISTQDGTTIVVLEASQGYTTSSSTCALSADSWTIGLYEVQLQSRLASSTTGNGTLSLATDGSGSEVCLLPVAFENVPERDLYVIATHYGDDPPCRACVLGTVSRTNSANVVFVLD